MIIRPYFTTTFLPLMMTMTGKKAVYITHSQGGRVGWATNADNIAAIVAVEPGFAPQIGSPEYKKFLAARIPMPSSSATTSTTVRPHCQLAPTARVVILYRIF